MSFVPYNTGFKLFIFIFLLLYFVLEFDSAVMISQSCKHVGNYHFGVTHDVCILVFFL